MSSIFGSIFHGFWIPKCIPKWSQNEVKVKRGCLFFAFHNASNIKPRFFGVLGCLWEPFGIPQVSFFTDCGGLLAHLGASFALLGLLWLSLAKNVPITSRESAENRQESAENRGEPAENPPYEHWTIILLPLRRLRRYFDRPHTIDEKA